MIVVNNDTTNNIVVTLTEKTTLTGNTYYLFVLENDVTKDKTYFINDDLSTNEYRYNQFQLTLTGGTTTPTGGTISNLSKGNYNYTVYSQNDRSNLDPTNSYEVVERGRLRVDGEVVPEVIEYSGMTNNKIYYR